MGSTRALRTLPTWLQRVSRYLRKMKERRRAASLGFTQRIFIASEQAVKPHSLSDYGFQGLGGKYASHATLEALSDCGLTASKQWLADE